MLEFPIWYFSCNYQNSSGVLLHHELCISVFEHFLGFQIFQTRLIASCRSILLPGLPLRRAITGSCKVFAICSESGWSSSSVVPCWWSGKDPNQVATWSSNIGKLLAGLNGRGTSWFSLAKCQCRWMSLIRKFFFDAGIDAACAYREDPRLLFNSQV